MLPRWAARPFRRSRPAGKLLVRRCVPEDEHRTGGGRNRGEPIAGHRNTRRRGQRVAHSFYPLWGRLMLFGRHNNYIVTRISKQRCTKDERERDACAANPPTAPARKPGYSCHAKSMRLWPRKTTEKNRPSRVNDQSAQRKCSRRRRLRRAFASSLRLPPAAASL